MAEFCPNDQRFENHYQLEHTMLIHDRPTRPAIVHGICSDVSWLHLGGAPTQKVLTSSQSDSHSLSQSLDRMDREYSGVNC